MRGVALGVALAAATLAGAPAGATEPAAASSTNLRFEVLRNGSPIGEHRIVFTREADRLVVEVAIDLEISFAFLELFSYTHRNREIWRDGRLVSIDTWTNHDGEHSTVRGRSVEGGFEVEAGGARFLASADILPTSYWHPATVARPTLLDTQKGRLVEISTTRTEDGSGDRRYSLTGDLVLELWYAPVGRLSGIAFDAPGDGSRISYRPIARDTALN